MRLSYSAMTTYTECAFRYYNHYFMKLRPEVDRSALVFGGCIDEALNDLMIGKCDLETSKLAFAEAWGKYHPDTGTKKVSFSKSDLDEWMVEGIEGSVALKSWSCMLAKGYVMIEEYNEQIMPLFEKVLAVQVPINIKNEEGDELIGFIDLIAKLKDGRVVIFDNKSTSVKYAQDSVRTSEQLSTYYQAKAEEYGAEWAGYIAIPKKINKKKKPRINIEVIIDKIPEKLITATFEKYDEALTGIKNGQFPANSDACVNRFGKCNYYDYCKSGSKKGLMEKLDK